MLLAFGGIGLVQACTDVGTSPTTPVSLAFDTLPSPSVAYGDTLRDINGLAAKLTGHAYNADNREIPNAPIEYHLSDGAAATVSEGYLIATSDTLKKSFTVRAQVNGIPSALARTVNITFRPDSMDRGTTPIVKEDTLYYSGSDTGKTLDANLSVRVISRFVPDPTKTDTVTKPVNAWLVRYRVLAPVADDSVKADTLLVIETTQRSKIDTTGTDGTAGRKIHLSFPTGVTRPDSVVVEATVRYRGAPIKGAPIRFKVRVRQGP